MTHRAQDVTSSRHGRRRPDIHCQLAPGVGRTAAAAAAEAAAGGGVVAAAEVALGGG